jgi:hypothetical protein
LVIVVVGLSYPGAGRAFRRIAQAGHAATGLAIYVLVAQHLVTTRLLRRAARVLGAIVGLMCVIGMTEVFRTPRFVIQRTPSSVTGFAPTLAMCVVSFGLVLTALAVFDTRRLRWLWAPLAIIAWLVLLITVSRAGLLAGAIAFSLFIIAAMSHRSPVWMVVTVIVLILAGWVGARTLESASSRAIVYRSPLSRELISISPDRVPGSLVHARGANYRRAASVIREYPWLGHRRPHTIGMTLYTNLAADCGLVAGACLVIAALSAAVRSLWQSMKLRDRTLRALVLGSGAGVIGFLTAGTALGLGAAWAVLYLLWYLFPLGPAAIAAAASAQDNPDPPLRVNRASTLLFIAVAILAISVYMYAVLATQ